MGEAIAADIVTKIIEKLGSGAFKKIVYAKDVESHIKRLQEIEAMMAAALDKVDPFEVSNDIHGHKIKRLRRIHDELVYFFEERAAQAKLKELMMGRSKITSEVRSFMSSSNQLVSPFRIADKVNAITRDLQNIVSDNALCAGIVIDSSEYRNRYTSSEDTGPFPVTDVFIGRDKDKENVVDMIFNSDDGQVFAIVGVGGQGKTTLAQYVCIDDRIKSYFDKLLWVYVTPNSDVAEILEKIITSATGMKPTNNAREQLHHGVSQAIVGKCLLVLDNVNYGENLKDDWIALRTILQQVGFWGNGGKVLITSRSRIAAEIMGTRKPYELRDLAEDDSWVLLQHYAIEQEPEEKNKSDLEKIGMEIAKMCPKVPLVLKTIGCQLAYKGSCSQLWEVFRDELASNPTLYMSKQHEKIKHILKLCYDQLDKNLKRCAVFCSLFPKGYVYSKNYMVRNWIALGFVESRDGMSIEDVGDAYVLELRQRAFFEDVGNFEGFKMHDVMHDLMLLIGRDKHQMIDSKTKDIVEGVCHISLNLYDLNWEVLLSTITSKQKLETILLLSSSWNNNGVYGVPRLRSGLDKLILSCQRLKILEVYEQDIEKVPSSIGELTLMRHLNLSHNPLRKLPKEITKLVNLLSLNLSHCSNLRELPTEMNKLVKLRHLWLEGCNLRFMPKGFGNLTELQTLDVFVVGENSKCSNGSKGNVAAKLEELGHLKNLKGCLCIKVVGQYKYMVSDFGKMLLEMETKLTGLEIAFEKSDEEDEKFLKGVQLRGEKLKYLMVRNYGGKRLPTWMTDDRFRERYPKLSVLVMLCGELSDYMMQLTSPILVREENNWFVIKVDSNEDDLLEWVPECSGLKEQLKIGPMVLDFRTARSDQQLPELSQLAHQNIRLRIEKELAPRLGGQRQPDFRLQSCFPNLNSMTLYDIPELEVLPVEFRDLSSLVSLRIEDCPKLKALPDWIDSFSSLQTLHIENAPELKTLPDSIIRLHALWDITLWSCPGLESLPDQISNLPGSCGLDITECSKALFEKCGKPTGEYWPHIQHLRYLNFESSEGDEYYRSEAEGNQTSNISPTTLMLQSSNDVATYSNVLSFRNGLLLIFVLMVVMVVSLVCLRFR